VQPANPAANATTNAATNPPANATANTADNVANNATNATSPQPNVATKDKMLEPNLRRHKLNTLKAVSVNV
jgi:hypothetical protein